jgi:Colicin V production protein.
MFVIIFLLVLILANFIGKGIEKIIHISMLGWLNRVLGFIFAALKIIIILCIIVSAIGYFNPKLGLIPDDILNQSKGYNFLKEFANTTFPYLRNIFEK